MAFIEATAVHNLEIFHRAHLVQIFSFVLTPHLGMVVAEFEVSVGSLLGRHFLRVHLLHEGAELRATVGRSTRHSGIAVIISTDGLLRTIST